ncbi:lipase family protein [Streptomyces sp. NPDC059766]|uniref:lipase family protein n=1 Tax=Streptomyces sp. NPDC059766 TaxID=3346940 RepID=UPI00365C5BFB
MKRSIGPSGPQGVSMETPRRTQHSPTAQPAGERRPALAHSRLLTTALVAVCGLGATALPAAAQPAAAAAQAAGSLAATVPPFYTPPTQLPDTNGTLIRTEPLPLALSLPGVDGPLPGTATRLMYRSTDSAGRPMAVTGAYIEPAAAWRGKGPRPVVAFAPGTMGQGDQCSASLALEHPIALNEGSVSVGYEALAIYRILSRGVAVAVTDYAGLGTTDRVHTYVNRVDEGHALLDVARAARTVAGASVTSASPVGLYGYSQGGGASAAAAELQPSYAPDVPLAGTYAGAPPADLNEVMKGVDGSSLAAAIGWSVNGMVQSDPSLGPVIDAHLNAAGRAALDRTSTMCVGDALLGLGAVSSTQWTTDGSSVAQVVDSEPRLKSFIGAQRIGTLRPAAPVRVVTGVNDDMVTHGQVRKLAVDWCGKGADVTYVPVNLPSLGEKNIVNHFAPLLTDQGDAISWLVDRLAGKATLSNCWLLPLLP